MQLSIKKSEPNTLAYRSSIPNHAGELHKSSRRLLSEKLNRAKHSPENIRKLSSSRQSSSDVTDCHSRITPNSNAQTLGNTTSRSSSAAMMSTCVILSRITGFARTWAMAYALGASFLASSYQVANNLPNMLYELVMGGMLVTAFLPVYVSIKKKCGDSDSNKYASNLLSLVTLILGIVAIIGIIFPQVIVYTQSFYSDQQTMGSAILLFQFFAIQTVFYGGSSIFSGLLNANRDYFWSSVAPVFNNLVVITTFIIYAFIAPINPGAALYIIAIGNPLGVFLQMAIQIPALKRNGIRLTPRIDIKDPYIKDTLRLGVPAFFIMIFSFVTVSVMNAASYAFADNGPSIIVYARLWYTLPYSFIAIPITTELFTELSHMQAEGNKKGVVETISWGTSQIMFLLVPFMLYLIAFSYPLVCIYHIGAFDMSDVSEIASYMAALSLALPFYGVNTYMQKVFSSIRKMGIFAGIIAASSLVQVGLTIGAVFLSDHNPSITIESIAIASALFYLLADIASLIYLKLNLHHVGALNIAKATAAGAILGGLGAAGGWGIFWVMQIVFGTLNGSILQAIGYVVVSGIVSLTITFGLARILRIKESELIFSMVRKVTSKLCRNVGK